MAKTERPAVLGHGEAENGVECYGPPFNTLPKASAQARLRLTASIGVIDKWSHLHSTMVFKNWTSAALRATGVIRRGITK